MWRPISEHVFPWEPSRLVLIAKHTDGAHDAFLCECADGGLYYQEGSLMALDELGWTPVLWTPAPPDV